MLAEAKPSSNQGRNLQEHKTPAILSHKNKFNKVRNFIHILQCIQKTSIPFILSQGKLISKKFLL